MSVEADLQEVSLQSLDSGSASNVGYPSSTDPKNSSNDDSQRDHSAATASDALQSGASDITNGLQLKKAQSGRAAVVEDIFKVDGAVKQLARLELFISEGKVTERDTVDVVLDILVGGEFDLENNFVIKVPENIKHLLRFVEDLPAKTQAEIWSMLSGILRKSRRNMLAFSEVNFTQFILNKMDKATPMIADLLTDMLTVLAGYSITVQELQLLFSKLKAHDNEWPAYASRYLRVLQQMPARHGPDEFFSFPGSKQSAISLPPMSPQKWPWQNGWTFSTWLKLDPLAGNSVEQEKPYVFCFQTKEGLGYSAHFTGNVLVLTSNKQPGKGYQACIKYDFEPRKWYHVALVYIYNRWKTSIIRCYVNGQLISTADMAWFVEISGNFDKCYIGASPELSARTAFCGQMSTVYMFNEGLSSHVVEAMCNLGPAYKSQFRYENECQPHVSEMVKKIIYDGKLTTSIIMMYSPVACDSHICLELTPTGNQTLFVHAPHAMMLSGVKAVITHSIHSTLHSIGGIQTLIPLFGQLDCDLVDADDEDTICSTLMDLLCDLLESSDTLQQQIVQNRGFLVISHLLEEASPRHLTTHTVSCIIRLLAYFTRLPSAGLLVKHITDHLLFNPGLWIHADVKVQSKLYEYLCTDYLTVCPFTNNRIRRVSTVIQLLHSIKHYYWVKNPQELSGIRPRGTVRGRPGPEELMQLRTLLLMFIDRVIKYPLEQGQQPLIMDDEVQCMLNFITTVCEPENLFDVMHQLISFMVTMPASMIPLFDAKNGVRAVFKLLSSPSEAIAIQALKLLGHFLARSTPKRKVECMDRHNLFALLTPNLLAVPKHLSMNVYNMLFELMTERIGKVIITGPHPEFNGEEVTIQNSAVLKVIANMIAKSEPCEETLEVKKIFLDDLVTLCEKNEENRRTILQMSVWQDWLFMMAYVYPQDQQQADISNVVMELFRILLYHAIKLEYGGWRVWIDTLSILHTRVAFEDFTIHISRLRNQDLEKEDGNKQLTDGQQTEKPINGHDGAANKSKVKLIRKFPAFRIPEFCWSHLHQRLVSDVLFSIELQINEWRGPDEIQLIDTVNAIENQVFIVNCVNLVSHLSDVLITAVGGLLPLLSAATTSGTIDVLEPGYGISIEKSVSLLQRLLRLADVVIIGSNIHLTDLEDEKNLTRGTMLRQCLRIVATMAVRNCLECRHRLGGVASAPPLSARNGGQRSADPVQALITGAKIGQEIGSSAVSDPITNVEHLLQETDLTRLRAVLYRDAEDTKQSQWIAMATIYFISVLMVSKYRDILEPMASPISSPQEPIFSQESEPTSNAPMSPKRREVASPSPSKRSERSCSPHRPSDSEDEVEGEEGTHVEEVVVDIHEEGMQRETAAFEEETKDGSEIERSSLVEANVELEEDNLEAAKSSSQQDDSEEVASVTEEAVTIDEEDEDESEESPRTENEDKVDEGDQSSEEVSEQTAPDTSESAAEKQHSASSSSETTTSAETTPSKHGSPNKNISAINIPQVGSDDQAKEVQLPAQVIPKPLTVKTGLSIRGNLSERLETALGTCAPLLREIFLDFAPFITKTLIGSKGQELLTGGLTAIRMSNSAVELVMLLCSQEWQVSLQKHAGLSFIELVNEGRLLSHTTRDHITKVASEAEHILNKLRADDANKHEGFQVICAEAMLETIEEELTCDRLITSAKRRDSSIAAKLVDRIVNIISSAHGPWTEDDASNTESKKFWKLDAWEDDSRRRRRMVPNPRGSTHPEAALKAAIEHGENEDAINQARDEFHAHLTRLRKLKSEAEISVDVNPEDEVDLTNVEFAGPVALSVPCSLIAFGVPVAGTLSVTKYEVFYEWDEEDERNRKIDCKVLGHIDVHGRWHFHEMRAVFCRKYLLQRRAIEIFLVSRTSVMFAFDDHETVKQVVNLLPKLGVGVKYGLRPSRALSLASPRQLLKQSNMTQRWQRREISNLDYIMFLNTLAGRSYNDLNQYPVFPWVISNYTSDKIDLSDSSNYRDLTKPIGCLDPERKKFFSERYSSWDNDQIPPFHYGTHYSTNAFTLNWLIRVEPYTTLFLNLQGGKFDHANRTFSSMAKAWNNCQSDTSDVKELIPELFTLPEMFINSNNFKFGTDENGKVVSDVVLPPWASSPEEFIRINREALESEIVSCQLHEWIDLIFGYKQRGREAVSATNVFYYLTYEGSIDLSKMKDPVMREAVEHQIKCFGQTPSQLLTEPHPMRGSQMTVTPKMFTPVDGEICMTLKFWSNSPVIHLAMNVFLHQNDNSVITVLQNRTFARNRWNCKPGPKPTSKPQAQGDADAAAVEKAYNDQLKASLPLHLDPILELPAMQQVIRRSLGDNFDERGKLRRENFAASIDNRYIFACGYWDNSFRVYSADSGRLMQVVYGHFDIVTCINRSEVNMYHDCFLVTGSRDCTCMLWHWNGNKQKVFSEFASSTGNPIPLATLTGHTTPLTSVVISAELGVVVSSSKDGPCLLHTMNGDLLKSLSAPPDCVSPHSLLINREGYIAALYNKTHMCLFSVNGRLLLCKPADGPVECFIMTRDGKYVITAGDAGVVSIWRSHDLSHLYSYAPCEAAIYDLAVSYDQKYLLAGVGVGSVVVFNVDFTKWHHDYQRTETKGEAPLSTQQLPTPTQEKPADMRQSVETVQEKQNVEVTPADLEMAATEESIKSEASSETVPAEKVESAEKPEDVKSAEKPEDVKSAEKPEDVKSADTKPSSKDVENSAQLESTEEE